MSISSSMNAGVAGLAAQSSQLATISDNIANSATHGYKRATTDFYAMVIGSGGSTYTAGGVRTAAVRHVEAHGSLTGTTNPTDLAVNGRGMLPVTTASDVQAGAQPLSFFTTTTGAFRPDKEGYLRTSSGHVLLGVPVDSSGAPPAFPRTTAAALQPVQIQAAEIVGSPTSTMKVAANLPAAATEAGSTAGPETMSVTYYDELGKSQTLTYTFTPTVPAAGAQPSNQWTLEITDSAQAGAAVGEYELTFDATPGGGGRLLNVVPQGASTWDATTGLAPVTVGVGATAFAIDVDLGLPGAMNGFTQLAAKFAPSTVTKDGSPASSLTGIEVDPAGFLVANYDSGDTRRLYQIPLVDVPNPNGLQVLASGVYAPSQASGAFTLWDAGDGPTGTIQGYAREESTVDVAQELTHLIKTQRAYSSNAKVIQTVDEMLQETTNIKR